MNTTELKPERPTGTPEEPLQTSLLSEVESAVLPPYPKEGAVPVKKWISTVINKNERDKYLPAHGKDFIDDEKITRLLSLVDKAKSDNKEPDFTQVQEILAKSLAIQSLDIEDAAVLLQVRDPEHQAILEATARQIKQKVYDNRIVTFAPLYIANKCVNSCTYCGFREGNPDMRRRRLSMDEIRTEVTALAGTFGHKRLVLDVGEHPDSDFDYLMHAIDTIYSVSVPTRKGTANIRRVNINVAPMSIDKLKQLKDVGLGTFQVFMETYNRQTYAKLHPGTAPKSDYRWRLYCMHRAMEAGVDDVGIGALFGLSDWRFELLSLISHSRELEARFNGVGAHTISFPRLTNAQNAPFLSDTSTRVSDKDYLWLITLLRLCVPYTGLICTAREPKAIRDQALERGITQMDASTRIGIGAYSESQGQQEEDNQQFMIGDGRSLEQLIGDLADKGHITSFCTAGYRIGRRGGKIMRLLRDCTEGSYCKLNAIITFREWLDDFASSTTKEKGEALIRRELSEARERLPKFMDTFEPLYEKTVHGCRDLYL